MATATETKFIVNIPSREQFQIEIKKLTVDELADLRTQLDEIIANAKIPAQAINAYLNKKKIVLAEEQLRAKLGSSASEVGDLAQSSINKETIAIIKSKSKAIGTGIVVGGIGGYFIGSVIGKSQVFFTLAGAAVTGYIFYKIDKKKNELVSPADQAGAALQTPKMMQDTVSV